MSSKLNDPFLNGRAVAFDPAQRKSYQPSPAALRLVRWMEKGNETERRLLELLLDEIDVDENTVRRDLEEPPTNAMELGLK